MSWCKNCKHWTPMPEQKFGFCERIKQFAGTLIGMELLDQPAVIWANNPGDHVKLFTKASFICRNFESKS